MLPPKRQMRSMTGGAILAALLSTGVGKEGALPDPSGPPSCRWDRMAKRRGGLVLLGSRWEEGSLTIQDDKVTWKDARDPGKNVIVPLGRVTGQLGSCDAGRPSAPCKEWGFRTKREAYLFRDSLAPAGASARLREIHDHVSSLLPELSSPALPGTKR